MSAHVDVYRVPIDWEGERRPWTSSCAIDCPGFEDGYSDHDTHAEALAAALDHCRTYPRKEET